MSNRTPTSPIYLRFLFLLALTGTFVCSILPGDRLMGAIPLGGYPVHLITFILLCLLLDLCYCAKPVLLKVVFLSLFGAFTEAVQYFVSYRSWSYVDLGVDVMGILTYFAFTRWFGRNALRHVYAGHACFVSSRKTVSTKTFELTKTAKEIRKWRFLTRIPAVFSEMEQIRFCARLFILKMFSRKGN